MLNDLKKKGRCRGCHVRPITLMPQSNEQLQKCQYPSPIHPFGKQKGSTLPFKLSHLPLNYHQQTHSLCQFGAVTTCTANVFPWTPPKTHHLRISTHRYLSSTRSESCPPAAWPPGRHGPLSWKPRSCFRSIKILITCDGIWMIQIENLMFSLTQKEFI